METNIVALDNLSTAEKIGQMFFIGLPGPALDDVAADLMRSVLPGGVCLFARNIKEAEQTRDLLDAVRSEAAVMPLLSLDQEGGTVDRLRRVLAPMPAVGSLKGEDSIRELASIIAEAITAIGFNMDFAPVVDVGGEDRARFSNGLQGRVYGAGAVDAAFFGRLFVEELHARGCLGCLKHFPGLGAAEVDSHEELPIVSIDAATFESVDLEPYRRLLAGRSVDSVMVAHAAFPNISLQEKDQDGRLLPASLSSNMIDGLLRRDLEFSGVVITDDLEMGAIVKNYGIGDACVMAVEAGADMLAICAAPEAIREGYSAVSDALSSGKISIDRIDSSVARILELKSRIGDPRSLELDRLATLSERIDSLKSSLT
jgi:beta-N-acetylhexosaminidase